MPAVSLFGEENSGRATCFSTCSSGVLCPLMLPVNCLMRSRYARIATIADAENRWLAELLFTSEPMERTQGCASTP